MPQYIIFMHGDAAREAGGDAWGPYLTMLRASGRFDGGSSIGGGMCVSNSGEHANVSHQIVGYLLVRAESLQHARELIVGNPTFDAGGTVEVRELMID